MRGHRYTFDRWLQHQETYNTAEVVWPENLDLPIGFKNHSSEYAPTPRLCVYWAISGLGIEPTKFAFVDIGSGRGRVLTVASQFPFREVHGIELDGKLALQAQENLYNMWPMRHKARLVCSHAANALEFEYPDMPTVFYLFNPFDEIVTHAFLEKIKRRKQIDEDIFVFLNLKHRELLKVHGFRKVSLKMLPGTLASFFSPYPISAYKTSGGGKAAMPLERSQSAGE